MLDFISYNHAMSEAPAVLRLRIQTEEPVEIDAFVGAFTSLAEEYRRDIRENYPEARIFVKEVRKKCIEADLTPYVSVVRVLRNQEQLKLRESLAHLVGLIMRRAGGDASVAFRVSFV